MLQPGRSYTAGNGYRYGFNGKEKDNDINSGTLDFGDRIYDSRIGRWLAVDNVKKIAITPYHFARNNPINYIDPDGNDEIHFYYITQQYWDKEGRIFTTVSWSAKVIENGSKAHQFFVHKTGGDQIEIFPFDKGTNLPRLSSSYVAAENYIPFADNVRTYLFGWGKSYTSDYEFLGRVLQVSPQLEAYYKNDQQTTWSFWGAKKFVSTAKFATKLLNTSETIFAVIDGYYAFRALASLLIQGPRIISNLISSAKSLSTISRKGLSDYKGVSGIYVHEFKSGKVYVGQATDLADRPVTSLKELLDQTGKSKGTAAKAGDTYSGSTKLIKLEGSGYKTLDELEKAVLDNYGGTMGQGGNTYNIKQPPKSN